MKVIERKVKARSRTKTTKGALKVTVNRALDKYNNVVLAPEKVENAEKSLSKLDLTILNNLLSKK